MLIELDYTKKLIKNEQGFTLAVSLIILVVLIAASTIVFLVTNKDLLISSRIKAEKEAVANAETAISVAILEFQKKGGNLDHIRPNLVNTPYYSFHLPPLPGEPQGVPPNRYMRGFEIGEGQLQWVENITLLTVEGKGKGKAIIDVGIGYQPVNKN